MERLQKTLELACYEAQ
ncbi:uncharacterized protein FFNC_15724 [Fusarium fujikuroi]|nr:uncharacterized protein FFNC_15724 [Fusarium fujikuroi]